jgi:hypothetical protein
MPAREIKKKKRHISDRNEYPIRTIRMNNTLTDAKSMPVFFWFFHLNKSQTKLIIILSMQVP